VPKHVWFFIYVIYVVPRIAIFEKYIDWKNVQGKTYIAFEQIMYVFSYSRRHFWRTRGMVNTFTLWAIIYRACSRTVHRPSGPHIFLLSTPLDAESCPPASATISTPTVLSQCIHCLVFPILNNTFRLLLSVFDWFVAFFRCFNPYEALVEFRRQSKSLCG